MNTILKILGITLFAVVLLIVVSPFLFKPQLKELIERQIDEQIHAQVTFSEFSVSLFSSFPKADVSLQGVAVVGHDRFASDTLLKIDKCSLQTDLMSAIKGKISVESVEIVSPEINAIVTKDHLANYSISKSTKTKKHAATNGEKNKNSDFSIQLKSFKIKNANITYRDSASKLYVILQNVSYSLSGDFSMQETTFANILTIARSDLSYNGVKYLTQTEIETEAKIKANLKSRMFSLEDDFIKLNDMKLIFNGNISIPDSANTDFDLEFEAEDLQLKDLLSTIPNVCTHNFDKLTARGNQGLNGSLNGRFGQHSYPAVKFNLWIKDGMFKYADKPNSVDDIQLDLKLTSKEGKNIEAQIAMNNGHFEIAKNPFDASVFINTRPVDTDIRGVLKGKFDLEMLQSAIPMSNTDMEGFVVSDISLSGRLSDLEQQRYDSFTSEGEIELTDLHFKNEILPQGLNVAEAKVKVKTEKIEFEKFDAKIGKSDITIKGELSNYLPYLFGKRTMQGELKIRSDLIDFNELLAHISEAEDTTQLQHSQATEAFELPENIDFSVDAKIKTLIFDSLTVKSVKSELVLSDQKLTMDKLDMDLLGGNIKSSGTFSARNGEKANTSIDLTVNKIEIAEAAKSVRSIRNIAPIMQKTAGKLSGKIIFYTELDSALSVIKPSIDSKGTIESDKLNVRSKVLAETGKLLRKNNWDDVDIEDVEVKYTIKDGYLMLDEPTVVEIDDQAITLSGKQALEGELDYLFSTEINSKEVGLPDFGIVPVDVRIKGTTDKPEYHIDLARAQEKIAEEFERKAKTDGKKLIEEGKKFLKGLFK